MDVRDYIRPEWRLRADPFLDLIVRMDEAIADCEWESDDRERERAERLAENQLRFELAALSRWWSVH
jgi:hypothetical protein